MKIKNSAKLLIAPLIFISPFLITAAAQNVLPANEGKNLQNETLPKVDTPRAQLNRAENQERRCELVTQRIAEKITQYKNLEKRHQGVYLGLENKLENLVNRLKEDGYSGDNIAALEADIVELNRLTAETKINYANYLAKLEELKTASCEASDVNFVQALKTAREDLEATHVSMVAIKDFYLTDIKIDLAAMREEIRTEKLNQQQENETETEDEDTEEEQE
ncbi:hypothetical protein A2380_03555 [candidate division WWE3 bacterium RIFOXYB1_FULL_43_24]|uniref:Uncharacterized protein n=2 Tax=Katanobacteria TaxID=422282 RepID=A0A0G0YQB0_UNCKA|nr:MAG: hypothetical protein UU92_C0006G0025 [candidate division WWE3 bacterium GW2011_GWA1_42_12]KKS34376.1 MAG: hypothetical protein UU97_C0011G0012 [candidate division WWE3 bacterium GW2011_GWD1_42_14]KKS38850.1 MAG: hypothetical protein UV00_C0005G0033 [candidate division WWE3 bacterium GW2011_GWF1_42_14]KKS40548.1 MAG: hypothetical protein UV03_C0005G0034 [candidate division WWE3 bacterium GW2011_GWE1_42_16]KKS66943.1 MAG: hypothetical protein UV35_C0005G0024 [candidate division WWE3 bacte